MYLERSSVSFYTGALKKVEDDILHDSAFNDTDTAVMQSMTNHDFELKTFLLDLLRLKY